MDKFVPFLIALLIIETYILIYKERPYTEPANINGAYFFHGSTDIQSDQSSIEPLTACYNDIAQLTRAEYSNNTKTVVVEKIVHEPCPESQKMAPHESLDQFPSNKLQIDQLGNMNINQIGRLFDFNGTGWYSDSLFATIPFPQERAVLLHQEHDMEPIQADPFLPQHIHNSTSLSIDRRGETAHVVTTLLSPFIAYQRLLRSLRSSPTRRTAISCRPGTFVSTPKRIWSTSLIPPPCPGETSTVFCFLPVSTPTRNGPSGELCSWLGTNFWKVKVRLLREGPLCLLDAPHLVQPSRSFLRVLQLCFALLAPSRSLPPCRSVSVCLIL